MMASISRNRSLHSSFLLSLVLLLLSVLVLTSCGNNYGTKLKYNKGELYYTENVSKEDAEKLGNYLVAEKFFPEDKRVTLQLDKSGNDTLLLRLVVLKDYMDKPEFAKLWAAIATQISTKVYAGKPITIHFCNDRLKTQKVIPQAEVTASEPTVN